MLEPEAVIVEPTSRILRKKLTDEDEIFSGVYLEIKGNNLEINIAGVAKEAIVEVGLSPTLTKSVEIKAMVGDKKITVCLTHEIVEMIEEALCRR